MGGGPQFFEFAYHHMTKYGMWDPSYGQVKLSSKLSSMGSEALPKYNQCNLPPMIRYSYHLSTSISEIRYLLLPIPDMTELM